jgi:predicted lipoprotein
VRHLTAVFLLVLAALPDRAGVDRALDAHILPGFARFAVAAGALGEAARADCRASTLHAPFHAAFDAWMAVGDIRLGPSETGALSVAFWPDPRGFTRRALAGLIAARDPVARDPATFATVSIAARGLFALEMLIHDPEFARYDQGDYSCTLARAITADLAAQAQALERGWREEFAPLLRNAGSPGNATFLTPAEAMRALYTQVIASLEFTAGQRLGRPLGSFERPRPRLAEAWRSGRSLRNALLASESAHALATALADTPLPRSDAALARVREAAAAITDPAFQDITDPVARLRLEILQQAVRALKSAIEAEIGSRLGLTAGFNAQDGD